MHIYQTSAEYRISCLSFFNNEVFTEEHVHVSFNITNAVRIYILKTQAEMIPITSQKAQKEKSLMQLRQEYVMLVITVSQSYTTNIYKRKEVPCAKQTKQICFRKLLQVQLFWTV